jgi:glucokinase
MRDGGRRVTDTDPGTRSVIAVRTRAGAVARHADPVRIAVIVNGPPGSGKSTLAADLAVSLGLPLLAKDAIKETLLDVVGYVDRAESRQLGAAAGEVGWTVLAGCPHGAVIDTWLAPDSRDVASAGLARARVGAAVEVWCDCSPALTRQRYESRTRHPGHFDGALLDDLDGVIGAAEPLAITPVVRVRTDVPVDIPDVVRRIREALPGEVGRAPTD